MLIVEDPKVTLILAKVLHDKISDKYYSLAKEYF